MRIIFFIILLTCLSCSGLTPQEDSRLTIPETVALSTVALGVMNSQGLLAVGGSGTYIMVNNIPYVITANHVLVESPDTLVACHVDTTVFTDPLPGQCIETTEQSYIDTTHDIAVLRLQNIFAAALPAYIIFEYNWTLGEPIMISAYPFSMYSLSFGNIGMCRNIGRCVHDAAVWWSSSGGGVFNMNGDLIGIQLSHWVDLRLPDVVEGHKVFTLIPNGLLD